MEHHLPVWLQLQLGLQDALGLGKEGISEERALESFFIQEKLEKSYKTGENIPENSVAVILQSHNVVIGNSIWTMTAHDCLVCLCNVIVGTIFFPLR